MKKNIGLLLVLLASPTQTLLAQNLIGIYQQAQLADPTLKTAELQIGVGEAQRGQAGGVLLPQISASANLSTNDFTPANGAPTSYKGKRYMLGLTQSVIDLPKFLNWQRYQKIVSHYELAYEEAQQVLMQNVVDKYFAVLEARDTLELVNQEIAVSQKQLEQVKKQFAKQMVKVTDVYELEAKLDLLFADAIDAKTKLDVAQQGVTELTGQSPGKLAGLRPDIGFTEIIGSIDDWMAQAQALNPALAAQDQAIAAAEYDVLQQHAKHLPSVDFQFTYYDTNTGYQNTQSTAYKTSVAAVNINIPLFSGGVTSRQADEATKTLEINKEKQNAILRNMIKETREFFLSTNASVKRIKASTKALESSSKAREMMEKGFRYGFQSISDILMSQAREYKAKKDLLDAKYAYIRNRTHFERATGTITEQSLQAINKWLL
jgi:outer membrane protein